jgi:hypothetical protein
LETRTSSLNRRDTVMVNALRMRGEIPDTLRVVFAQSYGPQGEPLLWLPDIVAGAVSAVHADGDNRYAAILRPRLAELVIDLV